MAETRITAQVRDPNAITNRALRRSGFVPAVYYTRNGDVRCLQFESNELQNMLRKEIGILTVSLNGEDLPCIIREVQRHPFRSDVIHIDLMGVLKGQKIRAHVPVHVTGSARGLKEGGTLDLVFRDLEVECLPADLPPHLEIDVTNLGMNDGIRLGDIVLQGVTIHGDPQQTVVHVVPPRAVTETAVAAPTETAEPEVIRERKTEETSEEK